MGATYRADTVIVGGGLAGLVTALDLLDQGQSVVMLESGPGDRLGGHARESFGGIFIVGSPEQRRGRITDSPDLALRDWLSFGELGHDDVWPRRWAEAYTSGCREVVYDWLRAAGVRFFPVVHWVERGLDTPGNSVPRFHMVWGTGRGLIDAVLATLEAHPARERLLIRSLHRVTEITTSGGRISGVSGHVQPVPGSGDGAAVPRGDFRAEGDAVVIATGGMCGDLQQVRKHWPRDLGTPPEELLNGSNPWADGTLHRAAARHGANLTYLDRMWLYAAGVRHWRPDFEGHALSVVPPKSALWVNWQGRRLGPRGMVSGYDTRHLVKTICGEDKKHSWQILNARIARREFAVSGAEFNVAMRERRPLRFAATLLFGNRGLVNEFVADCPDVLSAGSVPELVSRMRERDGNDDVDGELLAREIEAYDALVARGREAQAEDDQLRLIARARQYRGDRIRTCRSAKIDDPKARPLIAIREHITTRKSLGGLQTDLESRVLDAAGEPVAGLFAVGEAAGFGGGGVHGVRSLEGTFLGGCVFTGRRAAAAIGSG